MSQAKEDDSNESLLEIVTGTDSNIVSHLLAIERHALEVQKAHVWAENPLCLKYDKASTPCFKMVRNRDLKQKFIAVSWTWQPSCHESARSGTYQVQHSSPRRVQMLDVRDCVLVRTMKYLSHTGLKLFWIDRACIDQDDAKTKARAMNSMDLVYQNAERTLGILSTPIRTKNELKVLISLMDRKFTSQPPRGLPIFRPHVSRASIERAIHVLERLTQDPWWKRAWVFQEEYVAGTKMDLLFPLAFRGQGHSDYEQIPGELCISATFLRQEATLLLLAYLEKGWHKHRSSCRNMLRIIGKYQILLQNQSAGSMPMSATIHSEIQRRQLRDPWDKLAIVANACDYDIRLDRPVLAAQARSISMSLLAQYLLNGEIFVLHRQRESGTDAMMSTAAIRWMRDTRLKGCRLPAGTKPLSFLKLCRLPDVRFSVDGIRTRGLIWYLKSRDIIRVDRSRSGQMSSSVAERLSRQPWMAAETDDLLRELQISHRQLADRLDDYTQMRRRGIEFPACFYMDKMLWQIVLAVNQGHRLHVGYSQARRCAGIFTPKSKSVQAEMHAFTTWQSGSFTANSSDKFVSLSVNAQSKTVLSALGWMNGLTFFRNEDLEDITFAWPNGWSSREYRGSK